MRMESPMNDLPEWVPESVSRYVAHTEDGVSIRELARREGCHASTVLRQIRKLEAKRDDPLIDAALERFRRNGAVPAGAKGVTPKVPDSETLRREGLRVLRRLCESGAVLAVAPGMDKAVVVRDRGDGGSAKTAVIAREFAQAMVLKDWIRCSATGRVAQYTITAAGRLALNRMLAEQENAAQGFADAQTPFAGQRGMIGDKVLREKGRTRRVRFNMTESPLAALSRRKDKDGQPFLSEDQVAAGERLREDFELAQMGPNVSQNWDRFLTGPSHGGYRADSGIGEGPGAARQRVADALGDLGEGLSDVVLRCCCYLEGLEAAEKRLGWSARSGKIVLRIALTRLREHYRGRAGGAGDYIG
ncbi:DUF6456 domain-containing protein [Thiosulfatihalobacter marinus]|uniref:DUF6456 domain-containing protein n=1 Tax=Thiosulfatihalobacter marinus TaxID=2792481 RepID=UPI0038CDC0BB